MLGLEQLIEVRLSPNKAFVYVESLALPTITAYQVATFIKAGRREEELKREEEDGAVRLI